MDSTKVEIISKSLDTVATKLTEKPEDSIWTVVIPLLIGAGLTLTTQIILEKGKSIKARKEKKRELISKGRAKTYLISHRLKDLAMYKAHKQYYIGASKIDKDKEDSFKKQYEKGQEQRVVEAKLDEIISEYFEIVSEYYILAGKKESFKDTYEGIFNYQHPKPSIFSGSTVDELINELNVEEKRLNAIYDDFFKKFNTIQNSMV